MKKIMTRSRKNVLKRRRDERFNGSTLGESTTLGTSTSGGSDTY